MGEVIKGPWPDRDEVVLTVVRTEGALALPLINMNRRKRSCLDCHNATFGPRGTWCLEYAESIDNERTAASDCPMYDPEDDGGGAA